MNLDVNIMLRTKLTAEYVMLIKEKQLICENSLRKFAKVETRKKVGGEFLVQIFIKYRPLKQVETVVSS